ncbi:hypothetical protein F511_16139 [Dorcoceras hygrometricum]|uniref:Uncharacterized protein n=1 Tax=Dorcoceras hygrometricum TaxID=472368 RepID=A0A2Z7DA04_9LAMI|nr:hypothetical protein F511_16139 [Dorcoceras hygrometricum]
MQCTSYFPVYYHAKDLNVCANGVSWHLFNGDHNYVDGRGTNVLLPPYNTLGQSLGYDKDVLRQIIQTHDATFRFQVAELHRLYRKQKEMMDEIKSRGIFTELQILSLESHHTLSQIQTSSCKTMLPHATNCLVDDFQDGKMPILSAVDVRKRSRFVAGKFQGTTTVYSSQFLTKASTNGVEEPPFQSKRDDINILDLEIPAYPCHDSGKVQFEEESCSARPVIPDIHPPNKTIYLIDLNEPAFLEPLTSISSAPFEPCGGKIVNGSSSFSGEEAKLEPVLNKHYELVNCEGTYAEKTSSLEIDLNSTPLSCVLETENTFESIEITNGEIKVADSYKAGMISVEEMNLKPRASKENEVSSSIGIFKDIQIEAPLFSKPEAAESAVELERIGAETLVLISTSRIGQYMKKNSGSEPAGKTNESLYWFADIVASVDQEIKVITTKKLHFCYVQEEKVADQIVGPPERDPVNRTKQKKKTPKNRSEKKGQQECLCYTRKMLQITTIGCHSKII